MKLIKQSILSRIIIFLFSTLLLFSSVFFSYENSMVVKADDDSNLLYDAALICLSGLGLVLSGPTAGAVVSILGPELLTLGKDVHDYVTENEDGTTTISEDFTNLVLKAYKEYIDQTFDGNVHKDATGEYYVYGASEFHLDACPGVNDSKYEHHISGFSYAHPVALLLVPGTDQYKYLSWGTGSFKEDSKSTGYGGTLFFYNERNPDSSIRGISLVSRYTSMYGDRPTTITYKNGEKTGEYDHFLLQNISGPSAQTPGYFISFSSSTVPVYTSFDMMCEDLYKGDYSHAENYAVGGQTSSYTGTYGGGDITVSTEKLNGIQDKLDEINETDKSIDEKLKDLLDWLGIGDGSGTGRPNGSWYDQVLFYLDSILQAIRSLVWIEADKGDTEDDGVFDLDDMLKSILDDPETGSKEVADAISDNFGDVASGLTKKFPISIPWDLYAFFSVLADTSSAPPQGRARAPAYDDRGIMLRSAAVPAVVTTDGRSPTDAPYFELPIVVESAGIDETIHVDLEIFTSLSTFSRVMFSVIFGSFLIKWSIAFIGAFNEIMPDLFSD